MQPNSLSGAGNSSAQAEHVALPQETPISPEAMLDAFRTQHFVREAPRLSEIDENVERSNPFSYYSADSMVRQQRYAGGEAGSPVTMTEREGLRGLRTFLHETTEDIRAHGGNSELESAIETIAHRTSFIGETELQEATAGIAQLWRDFLSADPNHRLIVPAGIIGTGEAMQKSSDYLFQRVMAHLSPSERDMYASRIARDLHRLPRDPRNTKIILLDDWTISRTQLANGMGAVIEQARREYQQQVEVHLIAASPQQLASLRLQGREVRVFAYYRTDETDAGEPLVTGTHSSVDFGFEEPIQAAVALRRELVAGSEVQMPPLTNIQRNYGALRQDFQSSASHRGAFLAAVLRKFRR